jgi:hypothetical protein
MPEPGQRRDADHGLPLLLVLDVLDRFRVELVDILEHLWSREDEGVLCERPVDLGNGLLRPLHGSDVVDVRGDFGRDLRVVEEVHEGRGRIDVATGRDHHRVHRRHPAGVRDREFEVRVVGLEDDDVARPGDRGPDVALGERAGVVVARELADLVVVDRLLNLRNRLVVGRGIDLARRIHAHLEEEEADRVLHRVEHRDLPLERGVEQLLDGRELASHLLGVVAEAGDVGLPGQAVVAVGIPDRVRERVLEVDHVRDRALVELLEIAKVQEPRSKPRRGHDDVAVDRLSPRERRLDLAEELLVRVDVLEVVDLYPGLLGELLERRELGRVVVLVDVEGPVRDRDLVGEHLLDRGLFRVGVRLLALDAAPAAAGRQETGQGQRDAAHRRPAEELLAGDGVVGPLEGVLHRCFSSCDSITKVASGLQLSVTGSPGCTEGAPASAFCT